MVDLSTGFRSLDQILQGLSEGDNVVWQVSTVDAYRPLAEPFCRQALAAGYRVVYFRFATHPALVSAAQVSEVVQLHPSQGFESFVAEIQEVIHNAGREAVYIFDCLSELAEDWCSDRMLGNFFMLTCPYVFERGAAAYFALIRNRHSFHAIDPVRQTTQVMIDVYSHSGQLYIHPIKVQYRQSDHMFMFYRLDQADFVPVNRSAEVADVTLSDPQSPLDTAGWRRGFWSSTFAKAEELASKLAAGQAAPPGSAEFIGQLRRMIFGRSGRLLELAEAHVDLGEILAVRRRMIGTGPIGGKAAGLILAQAVLRNAHPQWSTILEPPDSFFIGADVFYTYLVQNGLWPVKQRQKNPDCFLDGLELARHQLLQGRFPDYILRQFSELLDYYGQAPIVVRSSSLLEDDFNHSLAGKGESVLCANQGSRDKRMSELVAAIQRVYASCMSESALRYRAARGLLQQDEQMAILVQRLSGLRYDSHFFPHLAGVGLSFNPYAWDRRIDPNAGVVRLVFGLGTRAVAPRPDDHTCVIALNAPQLQLEADDQDHPPAAQRWVDLLDLSAGRVRSLEFRELVKAHPELPLDLVAPVSSYLLKLARESGGSRNICTRSLTFGGMRKNTAFLNALSHIFSTLEAAYAVPVDVEFTASFTETGFRLSLLQCRPMTGAGCNQLEASLEAAPAGQRILSSAGPLLGQSRSLAIDCLIQVVPAVYADLAMKDRYAVARVIGEFMKLRRRQAGTIMLIGPGRWGTTTPALGVPVSYAELEGAQVICEVAVMHAGLKPDISLGSHFFNELVETGMLYIGLDPERNGCSFDEAYLATLPNRLTHYLPSAAAWSAAVRISEPLPPQRFQLTADTQRQHAWVTAQVTD